MAACGGDPDSIGDGFCDNLDYNNEACNWDGGDCCAQTCVSNIYECGSYNCLDPRYAPTQPPTNVPTQLSATTNAPSTTPTITPSLYPSSSPTTSCLIDNPEWIGNGFCNFDANNEDCDWDGGDCCAESCVDGKLICGEEGPFNCLDPRYAVKICPQFVSFDDAHGSYDLWLSSFIKFEGYFQLGEDAAAAFGYNVGYIPAISTSSSKGTNPILCLASVLVLVLLSV